MFSLEVNCHDGDEVVCAMGGRGAVGSKQLPVSTTSHNRVIAPSPLGGADDALVIGIWPTGLEVETGTRHDTGQEESDQKGPERWEHGRRPVGRF